jgi:hypothetical protein
MCHLRPKKNHLLAPQQWWHIQDLNFDTNISLAMCSQFSTYSQISSLVAKFGVPSHSKGGPDEANASCRLLIEAVVQ